MIVKMIDLTHDCTGCVVEEGWTVIAVYPWENEGGRCQRVVLTQPSLPEPPVRKRAAPKKAAARGNTD